MAYTPTNWVDHVNSGNKYKIMDNGDGTYSITYAGEIIRQGTPMAAENFNHMEQGILWLSEHLFEKVDKVEGKGLSTNDYTTAEKNKLSGIQTGANKTVVDDDISTTSTNPLQNKIITLGMNALSGRIGTLESGLSTTVNDISTIETRLEVLDITTADLDNLKVDKISGKGLSENDYTTAEKNKLAGIDFNPSTGVLKFNIFKTSTGSTDDRYAQLVSSGLRCNIPTSNGFAAGLAYCNNSDTVTHGCIGAFGQNDKVDYYYMGPSYSTPWVKVDSTGVTATAFKGNLSGNASMANKTTKVTIPRVTKSCKPSPDNVNSVVFEEYTAGTSYDLPNNAFYHIITIMGQDSNFSTQLALGMTTNEAYYRRYTTNGGGTWRSLTHNVATSSANGLMSSSDKTKLDSIGAGTLIAESTQLTDTSATLTITNDLFKTLPFVYAELYCKNKGDNHMSAVLLLKTLITTEKTYYISSCGLDGTVYRCDITCNSAGTITAVFKASTSTTFKMTVYKT